jgi:hypothetical protein
MIFRFCAGLEMRCLEGVGLRICQPETVRLHEHLSCHWQSEVGHWMNFFHTKVHHVASVSLPVSPSRLMVTGFTDA